MEITSWLALKTLSKACFGIIGIITGFKVSDTLRLPHAVRDQEFATFVYAHRELPLVAPLGRVLISKEYRNRMLAQAIESGCQDLAWMRSLACMAELNEPVMLEGDHKIREVEKLQKYWYFFQKKIVVKESVPCAKTPLERARDKNDTAVAEMLKQLSEQQRQQAK